MRQINTLRPRQNGRHFADDTFKRIFLNQNVRNSIKISLKFVPKGPINNIPSLVQIIAWHRSGDKPLSEPMTDSLLTHICVTRPQWVNASYTLAEIIMESSLITGNPSLKLRSLRSKKRFSFWNQHQQKRWYRYGDSKAFVNSWIST